MGETLKHYQCDIQPLEFMQSCMSHEEFIGFCKGNIIKYIAAEDIAKARQHLGYLARVLEQ